MGHHHSGQIDDSDMYSKNKSDQIVMPMLLLMALQLNLYSSIQLFTNLYTLQTTNIKNISEQLESNKDKSLIFRTTEIFQELPQKVLNIKDKMHDPRVAPKNP